jgi:hypothetical protein
MAVYLFAPCVQPSIVLFCFLTTNVQGPYSVELKAKGLDDGELMCIELAFSMQPAPSTSASNSPSFLAALSAGAQSYLRGLFRGSSGSSSRGEMAAAGAGRTVDLGGGWRFPLELLADAAATAAQGAQARKLLSDS